MRRTVGTFRIFRAVAIFYFSLRLSESVYRVSRIGRSISAKNYRRFRIDRALSVQLYRFISNSIAEPGGVVK
jgi:hypothetical protein